MNKLVEKIVDGELISPVLPNEIKNYLIDIDDYLYDIPNEEPERMDLNLFRMETKQMV